MSLLTKSRVARAGLETSGNGVPTFAEGLRVWLRIAATSFGGPTGQIAVMHRVLVEERKWISEGRFMHALSYCMLLPGPEAQQLVTYMGWLLHGVRGGVVAGALFVLPGFVSILALSLAYVTFHDASVLTALFLGLKPAVIAVVLEAVLRIGKRSLVGRHATALAAAAFVAIFFFQVPFPLVIASAALLGLLRAWLDAGQAPTQAAAAERTEVAAGDAQPPVLDRLADRIRPSPRRAVLAAVVCTALWVAPIAAVAWWLGGNSTLARQGTFFSKTAVVTFGGAYSVLSYVAQEAVERFDWLTPGEMLDGLGMAETTPGPLIQVVQFVAFLGAFREPDGLPPYAAAIAASLLTTWVTYLPCFLFILVGAPYVEAVRRSMAIRGALSAIMPAVVGVVLNLAVWLAIHTLFREVGVFVLGPLRVPLPVWSTAHLPSIAIALAAAVALLRARVGMLAVLGLAAIAGLVIGLAGLA